MRNGIEFWDRNDYLITPATIKKIRFRKSLGVNGPEMVILPISQNREWFLSDCYYPTEVYPWPRFHFYIEDKP